MSEVEDLKSALEKTTFGGLFCRHIDKPLKISVTWDTENYGEPPENFRPIETQAAAIFATINIDYYETQTVAVGPNKSSIIAQALICTGELGIRTVAQANYLLAMDEIDHKFKKK